MSADFIKMVSEIHSQRYLVRLQNLIQRKIPCGFFCPFYLPENLAATVAALKKLGLNLKCVCTGFEPQNGGGQLEYGIDLITVHDLQNYEPRPQIFFHAESTHGPAFCDFFKRLNIDFINLADFNFAESIYNFYLANLPGIYEVHEMLADEESKRVFRAFLKGKLTQRPGDFRYAPEPQYFLEGFLPSEGDIAIDGGAFDGATSRDFALQGAQVFAFEMSAENYQNCLPLAEKFNFTIENFGLSNQEGKEFYKQSGAGSGKGRGKLVGNFIDLDTYVLRKNLPRVDYIKLDIEGAELDMLHGAAKTISRWKPKMAVSAYHKFEDLWTLATYIKSLRDDYEFKFRHYKMDCTNYVLTVEEKQILHSLGLSYLLPTVAEAVLYCR